MGEGPNDEKRLSMRCNKKQISNIFLKFVQKHLEQGDVTLSKSAWSSGFSALCYQSRDCGFGDFSQSQQLAAALRCKAKIHSSATQNPLVHMEPIYD